jgi:hypothetical protein
VDRSETGLVRPVSAPCFTLAQDIQSHKVSCDYPTPLSFHLVYSLSWVVLWFESNDKCCIYVSYVAWSSVLVTWPFACLHVFLSCYISSQKYSFIMKV